MTCTSAVSVMLSRSNLFLGMLRFAVRLWGSFSKPSSLWKGLPIPMTVGRGATDSRDPCSFSNAVVAALYVMSWTMELHKRIVSVASSKVKLLWICFLDPSTSQAQILRYINHMHRLVN
jgi:hypothetical protein